MKAPWILFVRALLDAPPGSVDREIGVRVWMLSADDKILEYLNDVMRKGPQYSRPWVVAHTLWSLLRGAEAAA